MGDKEVGLNYYNWRYYNTRDGRWVGRDMLEQTNLYTYGLSNPTFSYDIKGMDFSYALHEMDLKDVWGSRERVAYTGTVINRTNVNRKFKAVDEYRKAGNATKMKSSALLWFMSRFGLSYIKEARISDGFYYGPEFDMKIVTYYPRDLKVTKKGRLELHRHENNRMLVYLYTYLYFIERIKLVKCKVKCGVNYENYTYDMMYHMIKEAYKYASTHLGSSAMHTGIDVENAHAVFVKGKEQMSLSDFQTTLNNNPEKALEYTFDGFNVKQLYTPTPPAQPYKPLPCP